MTNNEQLDILYKLKKEVEKSKNSTLIHVSYKHLRAHE
ncbi:hypothetical protein ACEWB3_11315, partial [Staphylococcus haemolyticus]